MLDDIQSGHAGSGDGLSRTAIRKSLRARKNSTSFSLRKDANKPEIHGGFALAYWNGSAQLEAQIKDELKVTIRCIPFENEPAAGRCIFTGEPSAQRAVWAKSY